MFKGVLFDLDGVITDTAEYHYLAWKELAASIGITIDREFNEQLKGVSRLDSLKRILAYGGKENAYSEEQIANLAAQKNEQYVKMIAKVTPADVYPGILSLLQELKQAGIKVGLASASINAPALIERMELSAYFDTIARADQVPSKPDPAIFELAAKNLGLEPEQCIGIEDAPAGIQAIKACHALPIGVGKASDLGQDIAVVENTAKLTLAYLEEQWRKYRA
ncbi:beta-phosphoglucomutase [Psittacicella melopsittaci]|uniref:Beta-phosphoglucomutase n=1 Tax=Psittacicella melopsittaci TaxID=2028576 RepID=A0A3A1Y398_9GAMM|nr:beta-phosphoglucomutase [Psittacicella melopsittaci]RIY31900.1 beta-phosphoglucomutase [Psittacicella melopsittaci]